MTIKPTTAKQTADGHLEIGGVSVKTLTETYQTPLYVIDDTTVKHNCQTYKKALKKHYPNSLIAYASKANCTIGLLNRLADEGLGADVVSRGELYTALKSKIAPDDIVFHGNNKSLTELKMAISHNIRIVVDNAQEIENILTIQPEIKKKAKVMLRLKPDIEAHTHDFIKTGHIESKFGMEKEKCLDWIRKLNTHPEIEVLGLHSHIGSQIFEIEPFEELANRMAAVYNEIKEMTGQELPQVNLGGGWGIRYTEEDTSPSPAIYIEKMCTAFKTALDKFGLKHPRLIVEPGRSIIGNAGITLYQVGTIKPTPGGLIYAFIDGGMADNIRPLLYNAAYTIDCATKLNQDKTHTYRIAGKFCESGDILAKEVRLPDLHPGDILVVYGTGAYNYSMASNYNRFCRPAMVGVKNGTSQIIVRREELTDLISYDETN